MTLSLRLASEFLTYCDENMLFSWWKCFIHTLMVVDNMIMQENSEYDGGYSYYVSLSQIERSYAMFSSLCAHERLAFYFSGLLFFKEGEAIISAIHLCALSPQCVAGLQHCT